MSTPAEIEQAIESLLLQPPYGVDPQQRHNALLALLKKELAYACDRNPRFRNYVEHWPVDFRVAERIADLPYLPVGVFKANPPLALVGADDVKRTSDLECDNRPGAQPRRSGCRDCQEDGKRSRHDHPGFHRTGTQALLSHRHAREPGCAF